MGLGFECFATNSDSHFKATPAGRSYRTMATDQAKAALIDELLEEMAARPAIQTVTHNILDEPIAEETKRRLKVFSLAKYENLLYTECQLLRSKYLSITLATVKSCYGWLVSVKKHCKTVKCKNL